MYKHRKTHYNYKYTPHKSTIKSKRSFPEIWEEFNPMTDW
jgi:hypothetical protein